MTAPLPVRDFSTSTNPLSEMRAHYAAVSARLTAPGPVVFPREEKVAYRERPLISAEDMTRMDRERRAAAAAAEADRQFRAILAAADNTVIVASRFKTLLRTVDAVTGISAEAILGHRRTVHVARARQIYMWACCRFLHASTRVAARRCGGRDHSTALQSLRRVRATVAAHGLALPDDPAAAVSMLWTVEWPKAGARR